MRFFISFVFSLLTFTLTFAQPRKGLPPALDAYIAKVLETFNVPGVAVSVVKDGQVLLAKGYGTKRMKEAAPVDQNTLFLIASNTKAFTATALAILVEEGKLRWDDKVIDHLPWFRMSDEYVTNHLTIRDLLVHRSGLPAYAGDMLLFPPSALSRRGILQKLELIPLKHEFRTVYAYDNILYLAAGEVVEAVSKQSWEDFIRTRIFAKVGMRNSVSRFSEMKRQTNFAFGHSRNKASIAIAENFRERNIGDASDPAGGICSNAADMANWLITQLDSGRTPSKTILFRPSATEELWKVITPMPISKQPSYLKPAQQDFWGYGLGFRTYNYGKYKVVGHGGALNGFVSQIAMLPDLKLGISVLTNQQSSGAYWAIINHVLDYYIQNPSFDWLSAYRRQLDSSLTRPRNASAPPSAGSSDKASLPLEKFTGVFNEKLMGKVTVALDSGRLIMRFENSPFYTADLQYFRYNNFKVRFRELKGNTDAYASYRIDADGTIGALTLKAADAETDLDFDELELTPVNRKIKDSAALLAAIKQEFANQPEGGFAVAVKLVGGTKTFFFNERENFHAASTMKTPVMIEVYRQAAEGKFALTDQVPVKNEFKSIVDGSVYSLDSSEDSEPDLYKRIGTKLPVRDLVHRMITMSSNLATNIMIGLVGATNVNATMRKLGAADIQVLRGVEDDRAFEKGLNNTVTAYDLMLVMESIANGKAGEQRDCDDMIRILMDQHFKDQIAAKLPKDVKVASKSGSIEKISHDSGIVFLPDGRKYVIVLLSRGVEDHDHVNNTLANVSRIIYDYFQ